MDKNVYHCVPGIIPNQKKLKSKINISPMKSNIKINYKYLFLHKNKQINNY